MGNIEKLIKQAEALAEHKTDGHLSILKFTTGYKIFLGTPDLDIGEDREKIWNMPSFVTFEEALTNFIAKPDDIYIWKIQNHEKLFCYRIIESIINYWF